ncbi:fructose-bisphosphate aldolase [Zopfia rhizophila CBS 207.26]|uniref:Fructose-bisphosphate aldolase n=1 Tax=Zopfia rhizophila CBS 207.26 TaxID=1314779 RepID=A0A6A6DVW4_9PEZI|nr:fructose-bisphosphate aldolase [Zopfia rhizophila CBS 207.26]
MSFPENNRTWQILKHASENNYAVGGYCVYNTDGVLAVIKAVEQKSSPTIIQLFPWSMHFQGAHFVRYVVEAAHAATVPIAVHLDQCIKESDVNLALTLPFDSIMIDASNADTEASISFCKRIREQAQALGIAVEVELSRIEGGEDGVPAVEIQGVHLLAPSFGNVHGIYPGGDAENCWQLDRLRAISKSVGDRTFLALHGTRTVSNELLLQAVSCGVRKVNLNRTVRDGYTQFIAENSGQLELTTLKEKAVEVYARDIADMMGVFGSSYRT